MKIFLLNPPAKNSIIRRWRCAVEQGHYLYPPMELCQISSLLKENGFETKIIDAVAEKLDFEKTKRIFLDYKPDMLFFMAGFESINEDIEVIMALRKEHDCKIAVLGHFPSIYFNKLMENYNIDYCLLGDPEYASLGICNSIKNTKSVEHIKGIAYRDKLGNVKHNEVEYIMDLDNLPLIDRDGININHYFEAFPEPKPFTTIYTARGCLFHCTYCITTYGNKFRRRSVKNVIDEIKICKEKYGIKSLRILDDTFTLHPAWVKEFCQEMINQGIKVRWTCLSRPDTLTKEIIPLMRKAGCVRMLIGVEAGTNKILKSYGRFYDLNKVRDIFAELRKNKIQSFAFFLIGAPDETEEEILESIRIAKEIDPDFITVNMMRLYPGTDLFNDLSKKGDLQFSITPYYSDFKANLTHERIQQLAFKFYRQFYFRPRYIIRHLGMFLKSPRYTFRIAKEYIKWELERSTMGDMYKDKNIAKIKNEGINSHPNIQ